MGAALLGKHARRKGGNCSEFAGDQGGGLSSFLSAGESLLLLKKETSREGIRLCKTSYDRKAGGGLTCRPGNWKRMVFSEEVHEGGGRSETDEEEEAGFTPDEEREADCGRRGAKKG